MAHAIDKALTMSDEEACSPQQRVVLCDCGLFELQDSIDIDPWNTEQMAHAIDEALTMSDEEACSPQQRVVLCDCGLFELQDSIDINSWNTKQMAHAIDKALTVSDEEAPSSIVQAKQDRVHLPYEKHLISGLLNAFAIYIIRLSPKKHLSCARIGSAMSDACPDLFPRRAEKYQPAPAWLGEVRETLKRSSIFRYHPASRSYSVEEDDIKPAMIHPGQDEYIRIYQRRKREGLSISEPAPLALIPPINDFLKINFKNTFGDGTARSLHSHGMFRARRDTLKVPIATTNKSIWTANTIKETYDLVNKRKKSILDPSSDVIDPEMAKPASKVLRTDASKLNPDFLLDGIIRIKELDPTDADLIHGMEAQLKKYKEDERLKYELRSERPELLLARQANRCIKEAIEESGRKAAKEPMVDFDGEHELTKGPFNALDWTRFSGVPSSSGEAANREHLDQGWKTLLQHELVPRDAVMRSIVYKSQSAYADDGEDDYWAEVVDEISEADCILFAGYETVVKPDSLRKLARVVKVGCKLCILDKIGNIWVFSPSELYDWVTNFAVYDNLLLGHPARLMMAAYAVRLFYRMTLGIGNSAGLGVGRTAASRSRHEALQVVYQVLIPGNPQDLQLAQNLLYSFGDDDV